MHTAILHLHLGKNRKLIKSMKKIYKVSELNKSNSFDI
jgi:hypothetical protein